MSEDRSAIFTAVSLPQAYARHLVPQLFDPWARELLARADAPRGASVLDVACGPGTLTRIAAAHVGAQGRVLGSDISAPMLAQAAQIDAEAGAAPISYLERSVTDMGLADHSFDVVLCQQGLQFFPDRPAALAEMRRVLAPGGRILIATWAAEQPLGLFGPIAQAVAAAGVPEPFPRAFDPLSYALDAGELRALLGDAGFDEVDVQTVQLECVWQSGAQAIAAISGTPFAVLVAALDPKEREALHAAVLDGLGCSAEGELRVATFSHIASAVNP